MIGPHQLDAVLHAVKVPGKPPDHLIGHQAVHGGDSGHVVLHIVNARQANILCGHNDLFPSVMAADDFLAPQEHAVCRLLPAAEIAHVPRGPGPLLPGDGIVQIKNGHIPGGLIAEDILLGRHILLHALVHVQMVGGQIRHHGNVGAMGHGHQLEAGELQHRIVLRVHLVCPAQEGISDVAAHMNGFPGGLQELCNDGRGGGLSV